MVARGVPRDPAWWSEVAKVVARGGPRDPRVVAYMVGRAVPGWWPVVSRVIPHGGSWGP